MALRDKRRNIVLTRNLRSNNDNIKKGERLNENWLYKVRWEHKSKTLAAKLDQVQADGTCATAWVSQSPTFTFDCACWNRDPLSLAKKWNLNSDGDRPPLNYPLQCWNLTNSTTTNPAAPSPADKRPITTSIMRCFRKVRKTRQNSGWLLDLSVVIQLRLNLHLTRNDVASRLLKTWICSTGNVIIRFESLSWETPKRLNIHTDLISQKDPTLSAMYWCHATLTYRCFVTSYAGMAPNANRAAIDSWRPRGLL